MIQKKIRREKMKKIEKNKEQERKELEAEVYFAIQKLEEIVKAKMPKSWENQTNQKRRRR